MQFDNVFLSLFPILIVGFIGMWIVVCFLLAKVGGWSRLAEHYQIQSDFSGKKWFFQRGRLRGAHYRNSLTIGSNRHALYLAVFPLFRVGHPPLLIPWSDITITEHKEWLFSYQDFSFSKVPATRLRVLQGLGGRIMSSQNDMDIVSGGHG